MDTGQDKGQAAPVNDPASAPVATPAAASAPVKSSPVPTAPVMAGSASAAPRVPAAAKAASSADPSVTPDEVIGYEGIVKRRHHMPNDSDIAISVKDVCNQFGSQLVHQGLNLQVRRGEILGVVGGSGTGKSVLLNSIIGLQTPVSGQIEVFGEPVLHNTVERSVELRKRWGVLFQSGALFSTLTVAENIQMPLREYYRQLESKLLDDIAAYKIGMTGLPAITGPKFPSELSGGMIKRAGIARALALDPDLLFLDEPTSGLDPISANGFDQLIESLRDSLGLTVYMITHDLDSLHSICDRVAVLADKKIVAVDTIPNLLKNPHPWIQEYFNGPRGRVAFSSEAQR